MTTTECNGCGACCDPFMTVYSPNDLLLHARHFDPDELRFMVEHLSPIRRADGRRMVAHWSSGWSEMILEGTPTLLPAWYYRCDRFDVETRRCTDYENRPDVCRDYPWYGDPPDPNKALPPTCSYLADVGRPVAEVAVAPPARR